MPRAIELLTPEKLRGWFLAHASLSDGCWEWCKQFNGKGYGRVDLKGKHIAAHRFSYSLFVGKIPNGLHVLHHCDNRKCVRPDHLFIGTEKDNQKDAAVKDRKKRKLTIADVFEIRRLTSSGISQTTIASRFGVHQSIVSRIKSRQRRPHVP
jgi:hypothetical protein